MAITGQGKTLGHCAELQIEATISQHLAYVQTDTDRVVPQFLRFYLETQYAYLRRVAAGGGSTKGALTCSFLRTLPVAYPLDLNEQRAIGAILDAVDRKIAIHERRHALLDQLFAELLRQLMSQETRVRDLDVSRLIEGRSFDERGEAPA
jgi:type I restriction enzyme S subunit